MHYVDGLDVLLADAETVVDEALGVLRVLVGLGRLEPILT